MVHVGRFEFGLCRPRHVTSIAIMVCTKSDTEVFLKAGKLSLLCLTKGMLYKYSLKIIDVSGHLVSMRRTSCPMSGKKSAEMRCSGRVMKACAVGLCRAQPGMLARNRCASSCFCVS